MYKRILVAIDGSNTSRRAFEAALSLASSQGAEHLAVLEAIRKKDSQAAGRAMRAHLENALERMFGS